MLNAQTYRIGYCPVIKDITLSARLIISGVAGLSGATV